MRGSEAANGNHPVWNSLPYLGPGFTLAAVLPINLGWRYKLTVDGNYGRGAEFDELVR